MFAEESTFDEILEEFEPKFIALAEILHPASTVASHDVPDDVVVELPVGQDREDLYP